jgi:hypothetical protein
MKELVKKSNEERDLLRKQKEEAERGMLAYGLSAKLSQPNSGRRI